MSTAVSPSPTTTSLLQPPNPSLSQHQPPGSILLNRNEPPVIAEKPASGGGPSSVLSNIRSSFSWKEERGRPPPAAALNANRARQASVSSVVSTSSVASSSRSHEKSPSPCIKFAPLPTTGLKRTKSITLGVAARSSMLRTQGCASGALGGPIPPHGKLVMTDAQWEEYRRKYESPEDNPPEIHKLLSNSTKKLWKKARSLSSTSSTTSSSSPATQSTDLSSISSGISSSDTDLSQGGIISASAHGQRSQSASSEPPGGLARYYTPPGTSSSVPDQAIMDSPVDKFDKLGSEIGSIREEDEDEEDEDMDMDMESSSPSDATTEEDEEPAPIPAYLRSDLNAERRHFLHEHGPASHTIDHDYQTPSSSMSLHELSTKSRAFNAMTEQDVEHETLRRHLKGLDLHTHSPHLGSSEGVDGDETPRGRRSPPPHANGLNWSASDGCRDAQY